MEKALPFLQLTQEDLNYVGALKGLLPNLAPFKVKAALGSVLTTLEVAMKAKEAGANCVISTSESLLRAILNFEGKKKPSLSDFAGSIITRYGLDFLFIPPLEQLYTVPHGKFLCSRFLDKLFKPEIFINIPEFRWTLWEPRLTTKLLEKFLFATAIAVDIETIIGDAERSIDTIAFTAIDITPGNSYYLFTVVVELETPEALEFVRKVLEFPAPKIFQNGKYDNAYLLRYGIPPYNWAFDTLALFHAWYSELPKDLGFITLFMLRKITFWKDEGKSADKFIRLAYNAKDSYTTALSFLALLQEIPPYAEVNFLKKMPLHFPCLLAEMIGLRRDAEVMEDELKKFEISLELQLTALRTMVGNLNYNPSSPKQTVNLFAILGSQDITSTTPPQRDKVANRHPLNKRLMDSIETYRKDRKLVTTYLDDEDEDAPGGTKTWNGRIFFSLSPSATDTGRGASKESAFWCGWQIQNIPRDRVDIKIKRGIISDDGFLFGECDRSQAETRDTAYLSGDTNLIKAVEDKSKDFHSYNASSFFGLPYERICSSIKDAENGAWTHERLDKPLIDIAKRVNHGANYNMLAPMLLATMKIANVIRARELLKLPRHWTLIQVCEYLLDRFDETYPIVRGSYYEKIKEWVRDTKLLIGPTGWTRYCFGNPSKSKRDMNRYAAHGSQSLNAMELDVAYLRVYREIAIPNFKDFKLGPQIHDSIFFQYRKGRIDLAYKVAECMDNPIEVTDIFGIKRVLRIPTDLKGESNRWSELKPLPPLPSLQLTTTSNNG